MFSNIELQFTIFNFCLNLVNVASFSYFLKLFNLAFYFCKLVSKLKFCVVSFNSYSELYNNFLVIEFNFKVFGMQKGQLGKNSLGIPKIRRDDSSAADYKPI